jgi:hypothetical protein
MSQQNCKKRLILYLNHNMATPSLKRLPTAAVQVRARVCSSEICGRQSGAEAGFLRELRFPLPIFIPPNSPSSQSPGAGAIAQKWPTCRVDPVWTTPPPMIIKIQNKKWIHNIPSSGVSAGWMLRVSIPPTREICLYRITSRPFLVVTISCTQLVTEILSPSLKRL